MVFSTKGCVCSWIPFTPEPLTRARSPFLDSLDVFVQMACALGVVHERLPDDPDIDAVTRSSTWSLARERGQVENKYLARASNLVAMASNLKPLMFVIALRFPARPTFEHLKTKASGKVNCTKVGCRWCSKRSFGFAETTPVGPGRLRSSRRGTSTHSKQGLLFFPLGSQFST